MAFFLLQDDDSEDMSVPWQRAWARCQHWSKFYITYSFKTPDDHMARIEHTGSYEFPFGLGYGGEEINDVQKIWDEYFDKEQKRYENDNTAKEWIGPIVQKYIHDSSSNSNTTKVPVIHDCPNIIALNKKNCNYKLVTFDYNFDQDDKFNISKVVCGPNKKIEKFAILAGNKIKEVKLKVGLDTVGPVCNHNHLNHVIDLYPHTNKLTIKGNHNNKMELEFLSSHVDIVNKMSPIEVLDLFNKDDMLLTHVPDKYTLKLNTCGRQDEIQIEVYPDIKYVLSGGFNFNAKKLKVQGEGMDDDEAAIDRMSSERSIEFKGSREYDGHSTDLKKSLEDIITHFGWFNKLIRKLQKWSKVNIGSFCEIDLILPSAEISGEWAYGIEDYEMTKSGKLKFDAVLFGLSFNISILKAGLEAVGVPDFIFQIPKKVDEFTDGHVKIDIDAIIYAAGLIKLSLDQEFAKLLTQPKVNIITTLKVGLKIYATANIDAVVFKVNGTASADACATFGALIHFEKILKPEGWVHVNFQGLDVTIVLAGSVQFGFWETSDAYTPDKFNIIEPRNIWEHKFNHNSPSKFE